MNEEADRPILALLAYLQERGYRFVTPTPETHSCVIARPDRREAEQVECVLGWSLPFRKSVIDPEIVALLDQAGMLERWDDDFAMSRIRVSSLGDRLFVHSAFPTDDPDSVFFGPDSYRFARFIRHELRCEGSPRIVDIGTGSGVGALAAHDACPSARLVMTDVNRQALRFAAINARHAGVEAEFVETNGLDGVDDPIDVALANPPYIVDTQGRAYRDGGDMRGGRISYDMACAAAERLAPGGQLLLYTGSAIVRGRDELCEALASAMAERDCDFRYEELDPDVFGEELENQAYADVDRIAVIGAVAVKRGRA